jgi:hypothetical protein
MSEEEAEAVGMRYSHSSAAGRLVKQDGAIPTGNPFIREKGGGGGDWMASRRPPFVVGGSALVEWIHCLLMRTPSECVVE